MFWKLHDDSVKLEFGQIDDRYTQTPDVLQVENSREFSTWMRHQKLRPKGSNELHRSLVEQLISRQLREAGQPIEVSASHRLNLSSHFQRQRGYQGIR